jgi:hypothetical protein
MWKTYLLCAFVVMALSTFVIGLRGQRDNVLTVTSTAVAINPLPHKAEAPVEKVSTKDQLPPRNESPVTKEEAEAIAVAIHAAVTAGDVEAFAAQFDFATFGALVLDVIEGDTPDARRVRAAFKTELQDIRSNLTSQIIKQVRSGGSYYYLGTVNREEGPRAIFRLLLADNTLNYHELVLARGPQGVRTVDMFIYTSGERLSEATQRILLRKLPPETRALLAKLSGRNRAVARQYNVLPEVTEPFQRGEYERVLAIYASLPTELRHDKTVQVLRVAAAQKVNDAEYAAAMDEYMRIFPGDPSIYLMAIDAHILAGRFAQAHEALDRLDQRVGGDPYLQTVRAQAFLQEGNLPQVEQIAEKMLAENPRSVSAHWMLVFSSMLSKRFETTVYLLGKLQNELGVPLGDLSLAPGYAEFAASPAFAQWQSVIRR